LKGFTASWRQNVPKSSAWSRPKFQTPEFQTKILFKIRFQAWRGFNLHHGRAQPTRAIS
jgi:hypothetical protein